MKKILLMSIFTIGVLSTNNCRDIDVEELKVSKVYESNNIKINDRTFILSNKNDSIKKGDRPKDPVKWEIVKDSIEIKN